MVDRRADELGPLSGELDVHAMRVIRAIADEGSITGAAAALGYSQPAVSQQVKRMEARLGMPLVERVGRRLRLTEAGRVLARHAPAVTTALDAAADELAEIRGLRRARAASAPGLTVTYVEAEPPEAVEAVREDRADIAVTFSYPGDRDDPHGESARGLAVRAIGTDELMLVLPEGHAAAGTEGVDVAALADENWIAGCPRCRGHLLEMCGRAGFSPRITFETDNVAAVEGLVAQGIGVATLPRLAVASFPPVAGILTRPLPPGEQRRLHVVTAHGADRVPAVRTTIDALERVCHSLGDRTHGPGTTCAAT